MCYDMFPIGSLSVWLMPERALVPDREQSACFGRFLALIFPCGNIDIKAMKTTVKQIGELVKATRKSLAVRQKDIAMTSGTGLRFIIELEKGKPTCQLNKVLTVLHTLGITIKLTPPASDRNPGHTAKEGV
jgi:HTH-type transcriptional regulator/antitoxin HipB